VTKKKTKKSEKISDALLRRRACHECGSDGKKSEETGCAFASKYTSALKVTRRVFLRAKTRKVSLRDERRV